MKNYKLTKSQKELVNCIKQYSNDLGYYYAECGQYKPHHFRTVAALLDKNVIEFHEWNDVEGGSRFLHSGGVYMLKLK